MIKLLARLAGNFLCLSRHEDSMLALSRRYFVHAAARESAYARYDKPAYLRRRKLIDDRHDAAVGAGGDGVLAL